MNFDSVLVRCAAEDFGAMLVANAMQSIVGVEVVSIVHKQPAKHGGVGWHVFAKFASDTVSIEEIDAAICNAYNAG